MTAAALLDRLDGLQGRGPRWRAICPAHTSKHGTRSLSVLELDDGRTLVRCHAGCDVQEVLGAVGLTFEALYPPRPLEHRHGPVRKPWRASDVVAALRGELYVGAVLLMGMAAGHPPTDEDRARASVAVERIGQFLDELEHAT